jgi:hypothetical protein
MALDFPDSTIQQTYLAPNGTTYIWNGTSWVVSPVLPASRGGTGFTTYNHGDILYGDSSKQLNKLSAGTSGQALFTAGVGADPYWGSVSTGQTIASSTDSAIAFYSGAGSSIKGRSGFTVNDSNGTVNIDMSDTSYAFHIRGGGNVSKFRFDTDNSILHLSAGFGKSAELRLYTGDYSYYTGLKPNATENKTYILPSTTPASGTSVLQSDSDGVMSWVQMSSSGGGAGTVSIASVNEIAGYYAGAGSSVKGSSTFTNDITSGTVAIGHTTNSTTINSGALTVAGGVGIGGSLNVASLSKYLDHVEIKTAKELRFYNSADTQYIGIKAGNVVSSNKTFTLPLDYGNSGQYLSTDGSGTLNWISGNGTVGNGSQNQVALYSSIGNSVLGSSTFTNNTSGGVVSITHATASGSTTTGALVVTGGVGIGGSLFIGSGNTTVGYATNQMVVYAGVGISGTLRVTDTTTSGGTTQGALTVRGGVGIGNNLYVGGLLQVSGNTNLFGAISFLNELSTVTFENRIIKSGPIALSMSATTLNGAVLQVQQANIKETGIGGTTTVSTVVPAISFRKQSFSATNPNITYSKAANVYIEDAPDSSVTGAVGSGNTYTVAITNSYALYVENGRTYMGGALDAPGSYRCSIGLATDQTIAAAGDTTPNFTSISDPNSWWNATTKRLTPTISGWYYVSYQVNWDAASITNNQCNIQMRKNGNTFSIGMMQLLSGNPYSMSCSGMINVNGSSDYLDFTVYTSNTTSQVLNGEAAQQYTRVDMFKIQ